MSTIPPPASPGWSPEPIDPRLLPYPPSFAFQRPEGWSVRESYTIVHPDGDANLIVSAEPLDPWVTLDDYVRNNTQQMHGWNGFRSLETSDITLQGKRQAVIHVFEWMPPDAPPVRQMQMYYVEGGRGYVATGTAPATIAPRYDELFRSMLHAVLLQSTGDAPWLAERNKGPATSPAEIFSGTIPRGIPPVAAQTPVGEERVYGAQGEHGSVALTASSMSFEDSFRILREAHGEPAEQAPGRVTWRTETTSAAGTLRSWRTLHAGRHADVPGFRPALVPEGTLTILELGSFFVPAEGVSASSVDYRHPGRKPFWKRG